jgi:hypothetical protein
MDRPHLDQPLEATIVHSAAPAGGWRELVDNRWLVLGMLFFVMAILGLPLLWMSRAFSRPTKVVLSIVVVLYTGMLFYLCWLVMVWSYTRIADSL